MMEIGGRDLGGCREVKSGKRKERDVCCHDTHETPDQVRKKGDFRGKT